MQKKTIFGLSALAVGVVAAAAGLWFAGSAVEEIFSDEDWLGFVWG